MVLNASALPDPREVSYDLLLACVLRSLIIAIGLPLILSQSNPVISQLVRCVTQQLGPLTAATCYSWFPVEADYTVVFFAAGARHNPGWNWVWKAYRSLNRKYRKNLKKLVSELNTLPEFLVFLSSSVSSLSTPTFSRRVRLKLSICGSSYVSYY